MYHHLGSEPLVSIVINNYNYGRFLKDAVESALGQTYRPVEVIVVDDGSTDQSREVIYGFGNVIKPLFKANGGQATALNAGFAESHGDIIIFLDADDMLSPDAVEWVVEAFRANSEISKVQYRMEVIDAAGNRSGVLKPESRLKVSKGDIRQQEVTFPFDLTWLPTSGNAFSAKALNKIMPIPEDYGRVGADWYLAHLAALYGPVDLIDHVAAFYRVHGANAYEREDYEIDLDQIRQTIQYAFRTNRYLKKFGASLGLIHSQRDILSVSDIAHRMISLKLDPGNHPISGDTTLGLFQKGIRGSTRRFDVSLVRRATFAGWFIGMLLAPSPVTRWLAVRFLFPSRRRWLNNVMDQL